MASPADRTQVSVFVDHLFRLRAGQMVSTLTRIFGVSNLALVEDVVQDALVAALRRWPYAGVPRNPSAWIIQVAKNRALDRFREQKRWAGKEAELAHILDDALPPDEAAFAREVRDDQLRMMLVCCHPGLSRDSQVALTLKSACGFGVFEIARAFVKQPSTIAQRLVRAKKQLREEDVRFDFPEAGELDKRIDTVLEVLYLMFNEGYGAARGDELVRHDLCSEAIRLVCLVSEHPVISSTKVDALAALCLFHGARLATRVDAAGDLLLLAEQDRSHWDRAMITRATLFLRRAGRGTEISTYHLEAEIAACHTLPGSYPETDWQRILECYDALIELNPSPIVKLNRLVAVSKVATPQEALEGVDRLRNEASLASYYPALLIRGQLLRELNRPSDAEGCFREALALIDSRPVQRWVERRIRDLQAMPSSG